MTINIDLAPEEERALLERARLSGHDVADHVRRIIHENIRTPEHKSARDEADRDARLTLEDLIDFEAVASCEKLADDTITLEQVRAGTSTIKDSVARVVIEEERAERI